MQLAISTLAFQGLSIEKIISIAQENDWMIEFSSGLPFRADMKEVFLNAPIQRLPHNYFPAPQVPFVLNLASTDETIRNKSINHCIQGVELASKANAPFFSAHAGFCIDPEPTELGRKINYKSSFNRNKNWEIFLHSVEYILKSTAHLDTEFLIENNVIAPFNVQNQKNPFLCVEYKECEKLINSIGNDRLGILLDTAHLKISSNTLSFDLGLNVKKILPYVKCIHHSDNDGLKDTNDTLSNEYWFLEYLKSIDIFIMHVLEVKDLNNSGIEQHLKLLRKWEI